MSTNLAITTAFTGFLQGRQERQAAQIKKAQGDAQLAKLKYVESTGSIQQQIDIANQKNNALAVKMSQQNTYRALDAYSVDSDPRHLNAVIREDPVLKTKFPDASILSKLDLENDKRIIAQAQNIPSGVFDDPITAKAASRRFLKVINQDNTISILDMQKLYAGSGYIRQLNDKKIERLLKLSRISKNFSEDKKDKKGKLGALERDAKAVAAAKERIAEAETIGEEPTMTDLEIVKFGKKAVAGVKPGQLDEAEERTKQLVEKFGGVDEFFNTDFSDDKNFRKAYSDIAAIERLENVDYTTKEKADLNNIRILISMGDPGKHLTKDETGIIDNTLFNVKKYLSDNVTGVAATSAYAAFRNIVRNVLFGSALTEAEIKGYREAFGTLKQQLGPVLLQFKTALVQVRAKLESVSRMKNPYSAHVRLGVDEFKLDQIINSIDDRIAALNDYYATTTATTSKVELKGFGGKAK